MELGRSAPMLTWASPGRAAVMVPAPVEGRELRGHRQRRQILQQRQWRRSPALAHRCGDRGSERSAEFGGVDHTVCTHARARGARRSSELRRQTDLHRPAGWRCGCWPTSPFRFSGLLFADSGATMELGRSAPMLTWASPGRAAVMVPAPVEGRELRGHRQRRQILQQRQWRRSPALAHRCGDRGWKDQRNLAALIILSALTRAHEARADPASSDVRPTCTGRLGGAAAAGRRRHSCCTHARA